MTTPIPQKFVAVLILVGVAGLFSLCFGNFAAMKMGETESMADCALAHSTTLCPVAVTQHLQFWQKMFVTNSPMAMLLALILAVAVFSLKKVKDPLRAITTWFIHRMWQVLYEPALVLGDYVRQAFSQGILHPKIY